MFIVHNDWSAPRQALTASSPGFCSAPGLGIRPVLWSRASLQQVREGTTLAGRHCHDEGPICTRQPGTVVLVRTGTAQYWGENGSDHEKIGEHDSAGIGMQAAKWLVEEKGAMMIGSDTSGLEYVPPSKDDAQMVGGSFNPVNVYFLVEQGVHILEFNNLEELTADQAYEFAYFLTTNAIRGTVDGTALRAFAIR